MARSWKARKGFNIQIFHKESTWARRITRRRHRARCRQAMRERRFDTMPRWRGTQGWITW
jgi:DNA-directed RNA polymerase specialized sigma24 family protein